MIGEPDFKENSARERANYNAELIIRARVCGVQKAERNEKLRVF
jgi:hypothetical protein